MIFASRIQTLFLVSLLLTVSIHAQEPKEIHIDFAQPIGELRPLHGGNGGPVLYGETLDLSGYFKELQVPYLRLHDCHWPNPDVVDMHTIFPDFDADPSDPGNYDFRRTDDFLDSIRKVGAKIVYRLGESIEHSKRKYYVHPPYDVEKWAQVCLGILRHYNEGWGEGHRYDIEYWEIWNEPENRPAMWSGSDEDYFRLYETTAKAIRSEFPHLKVGGPSVGYSGKIEQGRFVPGDFVVNFLEHCRERHIPLDFFSWHLYSNEPSEYVIRAKGLRSLLDRNDFVKTELHLNEWNYLPDNNWAPMSLQGQGESRERFYNRIGGAEGAAFIAGTLLNLQDSPADMANYFLNDNQGFGLFSQHGVPKKNYYAMLAFRRLLDTPIRVTATGGDTTSLIVDAGINQEKSQAGILIAQLGNREAPLRLDVSGLPWDKAVYEVFALDGTHNLESVKKEKMQGNVIHLLDTMRPPGVIYINVKVDGTGD